MNPPQFFVFDSIFRTGAILAFAVLLNVGGALLAQFSSGLMFLDLIGTAVASLCFGPLHGGLVGLLSNEALTWVLVENRADYFLYGTVHMAAALVWSLGPRLLRGRLGSNIYSDRKSSRRSGEREYPAAKILCFVLALTAVSALATGGWVAAIQTAYPEHVGCFDAIQDRGVRNAVIRDQPFCQVAGFARGLVADYVSAYPLQKAIGVALASALLGWPDHIASFSAGFLLVAFVLDARRYRMDGLFGRVLFTNRPRVAFVIFTVLLMALLLRSIRVFQLPNVTLGGQFVDFSMVAIYLLVLALLIQHFGYLTLQVVDKSEMRKYVFPDLNPEIRDAFEDLMKLAMVVSIVTFFTLAELCEFRGTDCPLRPPGVMRLEAWGHADPEESAAVAGRGRATPALFVPSGASVRRAPLSDAFLGAIGTVFLLSVARYVVLVLARFGRWRRHRAHLPEDLLALRRGPQLAMYLETGHRIDRR